MKILGLNYNNESNLNAHVNHFVKKRFTSDVLCTSTTEAVFTKTTPCSVYCAVIRSRLEYCNAVLSDCPLEKQRDSKVSRDYGRHCGCTALLTLKSRRIRIAMATFSKLKDANNLLHNFYPPYLYLSHGKRLTVFHAKQISDSLSFVPFCTRFWNAGMSSD